RRRGAPDPEARRGRHDHDRGLGRIARPAVPAAPRMAAPAAADRISLPARPVPPSRPHRGWSGLGVELHLVDATYELFRAYYAPRPPVLGVGGRNLSGVSGLVEQLLFLLREQGATHVGCATDRIIESFRNELYPGYKSSAGMPRELLAQFPLAERAMDA